MKILVTGVRGQLGHDVANELEKRGIEAVGVDIQEMDITDAESVDRVIREASPQAVIHCAAYTAVDAAEENEDACRIGKRNTVHRPQAEVSQARSICSSICLPFIILK